MIVAGVALAVLSACGAKGPLFLPKDPPPVETPADTPETAPPAEPNEGQDAETPASSDAGAPAAGN
ncbi:MAG: lipoprotein [Pseudoxanthomonas sp.]